MAFVTRTLISTLPRNQHYHHQHQYEASGPSLLLCHGVLCHTFGRLRLQRL